ncbi:hypothetical protein CIHG_06044 [Coccidioides immitis H538.4]|uniref:Uncharacterized protein n=1 Tax=Coccidioides immitis H538.4 TaxID=396776 RepID=A0A0J8RSV7_COCIT|nr:hypothetical protein CIHG_06044 [Coccidioides immitis H538.4]
MRLQCCSAPLFVSGGFPGLQLFRSPEGPSEEHHFGQRIPSSIRRDAVSSEVACVCMYGVPEETHILTLARSGRIAANTQPQFYPTGFDYKANCLSPPEIDN